MTDVAQVRRLIPYADCLYWTVWQMPSRDRAVFCGQLGDEILMPSGAPRSEPSRFLRHIDAITRVAEARRPACSGAADLLEALENLALVLAGTDEETFVVIDAATLPIRPERRDRATEDLGARVLEGLGRNLRLAAKQVDDLLPEDALLAA